ncbi:MAG: SDR family NAD(P)-dependent oxidoreductase [Rhizobiaceae bacterium]
MSKSLASDSTSQQYSLGNGDSRLFWGDELFRLLAITPLGIPDVRLARTVRRQQAAAAIDIGRDAEEWPELFQLIGKEETGLGLRLPSGCAGLPNDMPTSVSFLVLGCPHTDIPPTWRPVPTIVQVCSIEEAERALSSGAAGLIVKGQESGERTGEESSFILLQRVMALAEDWPVRVPVWCQGGIGLHTAAAAVAGGAYGVVLDSIMAGYPESALPEGIKSRMLSLDDGINDAGAADGVQLPVGQDIALARLALADCANIEALFKTMRHRISAQIRQARKLKILDEGNSWAASHGTRLPIAQGPMTRVSDTPEFAAAVANAGGLPFLALSLMGAEPSRQLIEQTVATIGECPWGIGVLGFAPKDVLDAQLDLVREFRPSALLLAGGRPSQARPFVEMGIPTYLHVPSPGLLELFLKDGATHFVFEGRECGGHVGPRYSFVLWEQALTQLMRHREPEKLHILFAGGIHDARSAAMVGAMAAPLAAKGAKIGVLMGTAYIATQEAVSSGAIIPRFQKRALGAPHTTLVETGPGHAIRCVSSGFVDFFEAEKQRLHAEGVHPKQIWAQLEALTVGRLRIASKGQDRINGVLSAVAQDRQETDGMYMVGQAIALKREVITVEELHRQVSVGATEHLENIAIPKLVRAEGAEPIAIVGMACIYPGAPDLEAYWGNIVAGGDFIQEVPQDRWSAEQYWQQAPAAAGKTPSKWGGFIDDVPFDPVEYGIPPQSVAAVEPAQLLSLETARKALGDAGYDHRWFDRERTSVIFGADGGMDLAGQYKFRNLYPQYAGDLPQALDDVLPTLTEDSFAGVLANVISGRIANRLGLGGANYSVDAACASSLTAIELGVKELRGKSSDMVLAGGADFHNGINDFLMFASVGALSATGRCRPFDHKADGIALGEGVGVVVLKRLSDAERDGDRIYAVIDGMAGSSDGKGLGLTAPRPEGQRRALDRAYWQSGVTPGEIGLVEAHGTGTVVGDRTELETLTTVFQDNGALPTQAQLGSVKSQIGHTKCAAGIAGIIKVAKALHHRVLPATQQITRPNPGYGRRSPFRLNARATPWIASKDGPARAAVSAFGFGGVNFHAVLSAHDEHASAQGTIAWPAELFAFRGVTLGDADQLARRVTRYLDQSDAPNQLRDLAAAVWSAGSGPVQYAFVAGDRAELSRSVSAALARSEGDGVRYRAASGTDAPGKIAALFSGQGSQYPNMFADLFVYFPDSTRDLTGQAPDLSAVLFPPTPYDDATKRDQERTLADTRNAQPALALVEYALFDLLQRLGLRPDMAAGHSFGELVALATAGSYDFSTLMRLANARAGAMSRSMSGDKGLMAAVRLDAAALEEMLSPYPNIVIANRNSPAQNVVAGPSADIRAFCDVLAGRSVGYKLIDTDRAFHSPLMTAAREQFGDALATETIEAPQWPVYSNVSADLHVKPDSIRASLAEHLTSPVRFAEEVENLYSLGARTFIEVGPRRVLSGLVGQILKGRPHTVISADPGEKGKVGLLDIMAQLAVTVPHFKAEHLFEHRASPLDLDQPRKLSATTWILNGGGARALRAAPRQVTAPVVSKPVAAPPVAEAGEQALISYLDTMRDMVRAQRDVLLGYFGAPTDRELPQQRPAQQVAASQAHVHETPAPAAVSQSPEVAPSVPHQTLEELLLSIIGERTGYPADKRDADLDLEADLSIDSIKRLEIVGELGQRLGLRDRLGAQSDDLVERLSTMRTLRAMLELMNAHAPRDSEVAIVPTSQMLPEIVSESTGYPIEALDLDLDLEADLSIDSIKRLEIVGRLMSRLGMDRRDGKDAMLEELSALKTLRKMSEWIDAHATGGVEPTGVDMTPDAITETFALQRYVFRQNSRMPKTRRASVLTGHRFLITDDGMGVAPALAASLRTSGATAEVVGIEELASSDFSFGQSDCLVHLWPLNPECRASDLKSFFPIVRDCMAAGVGQLIVAGANRSAERGGGYAGMVKTLSWEFPHLRARCLHLDPSESATRLASYLESELATEDPHREVDYAAGQRRTYELVPENLEEQRLAKLPLNRDSVVLLTGGARGITADLAVALALRHHCHLELVGRTPAPVEQESAITRDINDLKKLRQILLSENPAMRPAEIERALRRLLAEREIAQTLDNIREAGGSARYTQMDVADSERFSAFISDLYRQHGRIDGVVHGAGVIEDKLVRDKTPESFARVFDTKVEAALTLRRTIRDDVKFVVCFSSVASAFGNRGQIDYASANDVLDKLTQSWNASVPGRVLSVNWGPWGGTGMVSDALAADYHKRGIGLIPRDEGIEALLRELATPGNEPQVVLMCGAPDSFGSQSAAADVDWAA